MAFLTRRQVLVASAATMGTLPFALSSGEEPTDSDESRGIMEAGRELAIYSPHPKSPKRAAKFAAKMDRHFPGLKDDPNFQLIAPMAVILAHRAGPALRAYTLVWRIALPNEQLEIPLYKYSHPGQRLKKGKNGEIFSGKGRVSCQVDVMRKGEVRLVTPFFTLSPAGFRKNPHAWQSKVHAKEPATFLQSTLPLSTGVFVHVDCAVYGDRHVCGPDLHKLAARLSIVRNAEHDEAIHVLRMFHTGSTTDEIGSYLLDAGNQPIAYAQHRLIMYQKARRRYAQYIQNCLSTKSTDKVVAALTRTAKMHKTSLNGSTKLAAG